MMKSTDLQDLTIDQLVQDFAELSLQMGAAVLDSETGRFNRMFPRMQAIDRELRSRGPETRRALSPLLDDKNRFVRYYAAKYLLGLVPDRARAVIEEIAKFKFDALCGDCRLRYVKGIQKSTPPGLLHARSVLGVSSRSTEDECSRK